MRIVKITRKGKEFAVIATLKKLAAALNVDLENLA